MTDQERFEERKRLYAEVMAQQNLTSGRWAVAITGSKQWGSTAAIGDGITEATASLVTRCRTKDEAEVIAVQLNEVQEAIMPGKGFAWVFEAIPYRKTDYISDQNVNRGQTRDCDRRIANL